MPVKMNETRPLKIIIFLFFHHLVILTPARGQPPPLSAEDLRYIAALNLCRHFGGVCGTGCDRYIVHRWSLPLCSYDDHKCCIPETAYRGAPTQTETTRIVTTTATPTEATTTTPPPTPAPTSTSTAGATALLDHPPEDVAAGEDTTSNAELPRNILDECGSMDLSRRRKRIVGGSVSQPGAWPWLLALRSLIGAHACSGALVAQRWVVTAAHCFRQFTSPGMWRMRVGEYNLLSADETERDIEIANIFIYPGYKSRSVEDNSTGALYARYKHDLALVQLSDYAQVEPVCLPFGQAAGQHVQNASDTSGEDSLSRLTALERKGECWVAGWGYTRDASHSTQVLRQVEGTLVDSEECGDMWGTHLEADMICFGDGTRGPCAGDSGGPLSCWLEGRWYLAGVVSWGTEDCNVSGYPSVFTRLAPYSNWINGIISQQEQLQQQPQQ